MDQVKVYLGVAKKHHFWILVVLIIIVAIVVWSMATSALATKYAADKQTIEGAKQTVEKAATPGEDGLLPNRSFKEKVDGMHEGLKKTVYEAWEKLYARQVGLFHWPDMDIGREGGELYNIGKEVKPNDEIPGIALQVFNEQYVKQEWAELLEKVKIRRPKSGEEEGADQDAEDEDPMAAGANPSGPVEYEGLVVWPKEQRDAIIERYYTERTPSTLKVRLAQEDYWLFESLIGIINAVNGDATDSRKASIKKIEALDVAQWAIANAQDGKSTLFSLSGSNAAGATQNATPPNSASPPAADANAAGGDASKDEDILLLAGRYLDDKGQPFTGSQPKDPYVGPYAEFKQVFVHMRLIMDQRDVPTLIAACANATLPVETREVRVRMLEPSGSRGGFNNGFGGFGGMAGMFGGANQEGDVETSNYDASIELSGVIYLYNVPDLAKLGTGTSGSPATRFFGVPSSMVAVPRGGRRAGALAGGRAPGGMGPMGGGMGPMGGGMGPMGGGMGPMGGGMGPMGGGMGPMGGGMGPMGGGMQGMGMQGGMPSMSGPPGGMPSMSGPPGGGPPTGAGSGK